LQGSRAGSRAGTSRLGSARCKNELEKRARLGVPSRAAPSSELEPAREPRANFRALTPESTSTPPSPTASHKRRHAPPPRTQLFHVSAAGRTRRLPGSFLGSSAHQRFKADRPRAGAHPLKPSSTSNQVIHQLCSRLTSKSSAQLELGLSIPRRNVTKLSSVGCLPVASSPDTGWATSSRSASRTVPARGL
jgi:hypothetical protein